jgi:uncharacterized protein (TIGR02466 family)
MTDIRADVWFANIVWQANLTIDNNKLKQRADELRLYTDGVKLSNQSGWQSKSMSPDEPVLKEFQLLLDEVVAKCTSSVALPDLKFYNMWFNINPQHSYNTLHNHQDSILSGVYYVDVPDSNMGNIEFHRDDDMQYYMPALKNYNQFTSHKAVYKPQTGMLLLFPSWLKHQVMQNQSTKDRYSISFNYGVK